jgi:transcriptional regulator with XRE-family HTH domain
MDEQSLERRAEVARRLRAARWLAGEHREKPPGKRRGKVEYEIAALSPEDLAKRQPLVENNISATLLGSIERMERHTPPMELDAIARALGVPATWFELDAPSPESVDETDDQISRAAALLAPQLLAAARALRQAQEPKRRDAGEQGP